MMFLGGTQAFCGTGDCSLVCWDPSLSLDENLMDARTVRWEDGSDPAAG